MRELRGEGGQEGTWRPEVGLMDTWSFSSIKTEKLQWAIIHACTYSNISKVQDTKHCVCSQRDPMRKIVVVLTPFTLRKRKGLGRNQELQRGTQAGLDRGSFLPLSWGSACANSKSTRLGSGFQFQFYNFGQVRRFCWPSVSTIAGQQTLWSRLSRKDTAVLQAGCCHQGQRGGTEGRKPSLAWGRGWSSSANFWAGFEQWM